MKNTTQKNSYVFAVLGILALLATAVLLSSSAYVYAEQNEKLYALGHKEENTSFVKKDYVVKDEKILPAEINNGQENSLFVTGQSQVKPIPDSTINAKLCYSQELDGSCLTCGTGIDPDCLPFDYFHGIPDDPKSEYCSDRGFCALGWKGWILVDWEKNFFGHPLVHAYRIKGESTWEIDIADFSKCYKVFDKWILEYTFPKEGYYFNYEKILLIPAEKKVLGVTRSFPHWDAPGISGIEVEHIEAITSNQWKVKGERGSQVYFLEPFIWIPNK